MGDQNLDRLPKWARDRINNLERDVARLTGEVRSQIISPDAPWSNVWLPAPRVGIHFDEPVKSGFRCAWFWLGEPSSRSDRHSIQVRAEVPDRGRPRLKIMGGGGIVVAPEVTNVVSVYLDDAWR